MKVINTKAGSGQDFTALLRTRMIARLMKFSHAACRTNWFRLDMLAESFTLADCVNQRRAILAPHASVQMMKQGSYLRITPTEDVDPEILAYCEKQLTPAADVSYRSLTHGTSAGY